MSSLPTPAQLRRIARSAAQAAGTPIAEAFRSGVAAHTKTSAHDLVTTYDTAAEDALKASLTHAVPDCRITAEEGGMQGEGTVEWIIDPIDGTSNFAHGFAMFSISVAAAVHGEVVAGVVHDPVHHRTFSADDAGAYLHTPGSRQRLGPASHTTAPRQRTQPSDKRAENADPVHREPHLNLMTSFPHAELLVQHRDWAMHSFAELVLTHSTVRRVVSGALELCFAAAGWAEIVLGTHTKPWDVAAAQLILRRAGGSYLPYGQRNHNAPYSWQGSWCGEPERRGHLAPHYLGLAPGVDSAPTAEGILQQLSAMDAAHHPAATAL